MNPRLVYRVVVVTFSFSKKSIVLTDECAEALSWRGRILRYYSSLTVCTTCVLADIGEMILNLLSRAPPTSPLQTYLGGSSIGKQLTENCRRFGSEYIYAPVTILYVSFNRPPSNCSSTKRHHLVILFFISLRVNFLESPKCLWTMICANVGPIFPNHWWSQNVRYWSPLIICFTASMFSFAGRPGQFSFSIHCAFSQRCVTVGSFCCRVELSCGSWSLRD